MNTTTAQKTNGFKLADGIKNIFSSDKGNTDKASEQYVLNPTDIHPENVETFEEQIDRKKLEIERMGVELEVEVAEIEHKKKSKIHKEKAKRKTFKEWMTIWKTRISANFEEHKSLYVISVLLFAASVFFHSKSFEVFLAIFLPTLFPVILFSLALLISLGLEGLATSLYSEYKDSLANSIYALSFTIILGMGFYQYTLGQSVTIAAWRTGLGSISLIGLYVSHRAMREKEFWKSRKKFNELPKVFRKEINNLLEKLLSEHKAGNTDYRLNFKDLLKTYNLQSSSLEKLLVRKGLREKKYFKELPVRRREKNKIVKAQKETKRVERAYAYEKDKTDLSEQTQKEKEYVEKPILQSKIILT